MSEPGEAEGVVIPPHFPDVDDEELRKLSVRAGRQLIEAARRSGAPNSVLMHGELLDLARGEEHRRAILRQAKATKWSILIATLALVASAVSSTIAVVVALE